MSQDSPESPKLGNVRTVKPIFVRKGPCPVDESRRRIVEGCSAEESLAQSHSACRGWYQKMKEVLTQMWEQRYVDVSV